DKTPPSGPNLPPYPTPPSGQHPVTNVNSALPALPALPVPAAPVTTRPVPVSGSPGILPSVLGAAIDILGSAGGVTPPAPAPATAVPVQKRPAVGSAHSHRVVAMLLATVVVIGAAAAGFLVWISRQGDNVGAAPAPPAVHAAGAYHAVYRVTDSAGPQAIAQTDVVS